MALVSLDLQRLHLNLQILQIGHQQPSWSIFINSLQSGHSANILAIEEGVNKDTVELEVGHREV